MKNLKLTKVIASSLIVASVLALNPIGASASWRQDSNGWWNTEGSSYSTGWRSIEGKWYYFYPSTGYMASDAWVDGYYVGTDGTIPQSVGFDKMRLSTDTYDYVSKYYNIKYWDINNINELSISGTNYLNVYNKSNIIGIQDWDYGNGWNSDYIFNLANKYSRFTAVVGIDDSSRNKNSSLQLTIIADGNVLDTKKLKYGEDSIKIDVNISGYNKLIIRIGEHDAGTYSINYDILDGKFYFKS